MHFTTSVIVFSADYGERYPRDVFGNVAQFLDDDPSEVVVLLFQASSGRESLVWNELHREMAAAAGLADRIYAHQRGTRWPTMGELVDSDRRVLAFYFNGGTCDDGGCPPGFHPFYNYAAETQYQSSSLDDLRDYEYSCEITRGPKEDAAFGPDFLVVNNFVTPPDFDAAAITNSRAFLAERLTNCANRAQMRPNFVYLDFWSQGVTAQVRLLLGKVFSVLFAVRSKIVAPTIVCSWCNTQINKLQRDWGSRIQCPPNPMVMEYGSLSMYIF